MSLTHLFYKWRLLNHGKKRNFTEVVDKKKKPKRRYSAGDKWDIYNASCVALYLPPPGEEDFLNKRIQKMLDANKSDVVGKDSS